MGFLIFGLIEVGPKNGMEVFDMDISNPDRSRINHEYIVKVLTDMVADLISQKEFGTLPAFLTFSEQIFAKIDAPGYIAEKVSFSHSFTLEENDIQTMQLHCDGQEMKATLNAKVMLILKSEELTASFPLQIKADFCSLVGRTSVDEANVTFTLPDGTPIRYNGRHIEVTFVDRLPLHGMRAGG